jgi:hypothetical protein
MRRDSLLKPLGLVFVGVVLLYLLAFYGIEYARTRKGGWQVTFQTDNGGVPELLVAHPRLGIRDVRIAFPEQRLPRASLRERVQFDQPQTNIPFGKVIYFDTTFLPGSIVFDLFGHQIQLLPRTLIVDRKEVPWTPGMTLRL